MTQSEAMALLKMGYNVFLTGAPGSGKTFLLNKYIEFLRQHGKKVAITATTGIAATHLGGKTIHSWSGLGIRETVTDKEIRAMLKKPYLKKAIKASQVLIIDEISMLKAAQFEALDRICQYFKASFLPFGGIQVVCSGDFFQLPPVTRMGEEMKFVTASSSWNTMDMKVCYLNEQFRHSDSKLAALLSKIRDNRPIEAQQALMVAATASDGEFLTKLYTHNADVDTINARELEKISGNKRMYPMLTTGKREVSDALKRSCLAPENLELKIGARVMFIKNNFDEGYVNGTQGRVVEFDDMSGLPVVETLDGKRIFASPAEWAIEDETGYQVATLQQLPLRLAWAITVHKSQGMNLDAAEIDLSKCFVEGMGYVALSRLKTLAGLKLQGVNEMAFLVHPDALEVDAKFRDASAKVAEFLNSMSSADRARRQEKFFAAKA